jgi:hypothetical protein
MSWHILAGTKDFKRQENTLAKWRSALFRDISFICGQIVLHSTGRHIISSFNLSDRASDPRHNVVLRA